MKTSYRRNLPHIQPVGSCFFVTFRLYESLPKVESDKLKLKYQAQLYDLHKVINDKLRNEAIFSLIKHLFAKLDDLIDSTENGPHHLKNNEIRELVSKELFRFDGNLYNLIAYSIMSNHVHILIDTSIQLDEMKQEGIIENYVQLDQIMKRIKGPTAVYCNRKLGLSGKFWERESYDMYIRNEKMFNNVLLYILNNPVKAGIVNNWKDYPGNYCKP